MNSKQKEIEQGLQDYEDDQDMEDAELWTDLDDIMNNMIGWEDEF
jgi:hypothetical protein